MGPRDAAPQMRGAEGRITNVFVLMLENHSFDHVFAMSGIPGITVADLSDQNTYTPSGSTAPTTCHVRDGAPSSMSTDPAHEFPDVLRQLCNVATCGSDDDGADCYRGGAYPPVNLSGFAASYATSRSEGTGIPAPDRVGDIMACFHTETQLPVIYQLARQYAICDGWFASMPGPTWPNRFFVHGASSSGMDRGPTLGEDIEWESVHGFTYANGSIFDALSSAGHEYRLYQDKDNQFSDRPSNWAQGGWISQVAALKGISLFDIRSLRHFAADLQEPAYGQCRYTFIEPNFGASFLSRQGGEPGPRYTGGSSQHPEDDMYGGEALIKHVYEAIRNSPVWGTSLLVIVYDEHGGFYDSVKPGVAPPPDDLSPEEARARKLNRYGFDFGHYGPRVPAVVVSPLIAKGTVDHTVYDHSSILRTLGRWLDLPPLTRRDAQANDVLHLLRGPARGDDDCPRALVEPARPEPVVGTVGGPEGTGGGPEGTAAPLPEAGNSTGFLRILLKAELELAGSDRGRAKGVIEEFGKISSPAHARDYAERMWHAIVGAPERPGK
jgi:phospholipase C